tara:strand:+ start:66 stop:506 length:441 start_codon:yes stop_codon:yes gene_type:complete
MAYIDKNKKKFIADRDENQFIGFKLPFELDNGGFNSLTTETLDAVKQNLLNLLNTEMGERVMQPNLGVRIRRYLFEPYRDGVITGIQDSLIETFSYWLPFVTINDINVQMSERTEGTLKNTMLISVDFSLKKDPNTMESVQVTIGE